MIDFKNGLVAMHSIAKLVFDVLENVVLKCGETGFIEMDFQALLV